MPIRFWVGTVLAVALALPVMPAAAASINWAHARQVNETTRDYEFVPSHLVFRRGAVYRLHLENRGKETHEFHSPAFFAAITMRNPGVLNADHTEIVLQPGDRKDLYFVARRRGHFRLICPDHDWAGMTGEIDVK